MVTLDATHSSWFGYEEVDELRRIEAGQGVNEELLDTIQMITTIMKGMQEDIAYDR